VSRLTIERTFAEQAENDSVRANEHVLLGLLVACDPKWRGGGYWCRCPVHDERTASCRVNAKGGCWRWKCFGCGAGGDAFDLVMKLEGCGFREARRRLVAGTATPAVVAAPKRPEASHVIACERRGCTTGEGLAIGLLVTMAEVVAGLDTGALRGGLIAEPFPGDIRWVCMRCERELRAARRTYALWRMLNAPAPPVRGAERRAA
jgi:hypothetical protein